jgi:hypothetical protein
MSDENKFKASEEDKSGLDLRRSIDRDADLMDASLN